MSRSNLSVKFMLRNTERKRERGVLFNDVKRVLNYKAYDSFILFDSMFLTSYE